MYVRATANGHKSMLEMFGFKIDSNSASYPKGHKRAHYSTELILGINVLTLNTLRVASEATYQKLISINTYMKGVLTDTILQIGQNLRAKQ